MKKCSSVTLVFLEIPQYSIEAWNKAKGHRDPKIFHSQDFVLLERIALVNEYIHSVNERSSEHRKTPLCSPRFKLDLLKFRKEKGGKQRRSLNFSNYRAGDHLFGKLLFTWLSLVVSMVMSFCAVLFPTRCLG